MGSDIGRCIDRISKLPDSLLCHILSFLPTKHAVGTSVLSTRWQHLWTTVPCFNFNESNLFHEYPELSEDRIEEVQLSFQHFVTRVLLLSDAPCFQKFHLEGSIGLVDHVDTWICAAIKRNVRDMLLRNWDDINIQLPHVLFTSTTLVVLTLHGVLLNVPHSVCLPSLKTLKLDTVEYRNEVSLQNLLSGCPVLEELYIQKWMGDTQRVLNVSAPALKRLTVHCNRDDCEEKLDDSDESDDQGCKLVVDTPQLECLCLFDCVSEEFLLTNLYSLSKACIIVGPTHLRPNSSNGDGLRVYKLLTAITNVMFLDAFLSFQNDVNGYLLPTFHNLTRLKLGTEGFDSLNLKLLADFLQCSPNLEVFILKGIGFNNAVKTWNPPEQVPRCLLSHLKEIQIKEFCGEDYELELIEYLLKNAKVLKMMTIDYRYSADCLCGLLGAITRGSKSSQLNLLLCSCLNILRSSSGDGDALKLVS